MKEFKNVTEKDLPQMVERVIALVGQQSVDQVTVVCLEGDLGAGKTTLTKYFAKALSVSEYVKSPTYTIAQKYSISSPLLPQKKTLIHVDAYRLQSEADAEVVGLREWVVDPMVVLVVEWPQKIEGLLPSQTIWITIRESEDKNTDFARDYTISVGR